MRTIFGALAVAQFLPLCAAAQQESSPLKEALERRIIDANLPMFEVQAFTEARIPRMPQVMTVQQWEQQAERMRRQTLEKVVFRGQAAAWREAPMRAEWLDTLEGGPGYHIRKLRYEAVPGLWIPALLYEPQRLEGKVPVVMNVNGHDRKGKAAPYKQIRCINEAKRGMVALNLEWLGMGQLRVPGLLHYRMNQLNLCGTSGLAPFYLVMQRGLDILLSHPHADPQRVAVAGLSGGGWQTIVISSLDPRVTLANPVAGYSSFRTRARYLSDLGDPEQTPCDLATITDYAQLTAMRAPRPTLLTNNAKDNCCFKAEHTLPPLLAAARPIFALYGQEANLRYHVNHDPGTHNFQRDNRQQLYRMLGDYFFPGDPDYDWHEIPSEAEVKGREVLDVPLPADNADFNVLARRLSNQLPRQAALPRDKADVAAWQQGRRRCLAEIVRARHYDVLPVLDKTEQIGDLTARWWWLLTGGTWTVPAVELAGQPDGPVALIIADEGRASVVDPAERLLGRGYRVVALDPFFFGESKIAQRDVLFALLVSAVGERPLGIQASQIAAVARWAKADLEVAPQLVCVGPRCSLIGLVAAGLEPEAIGSVRLHGSLGSLKELIEQNKTAREAPEMFCFGLLEQFDIRQLTALVAPRTVCFAEPSERVRQELAELRGLDWAGQVSLEPAAAEETD